MKYLIICVLFLTCFALHAVDERPKYFHEIHNDSYLSSVKHYLDVSDAYLLEGDVSSAKIYYDNAYQLNKCLTMRDNATEMRIVFSKLLLNIIHDKNKNAVKDFIKSIMDRIEYKEGKWIVDLENINF